jgi:thiol:disulfide interchange protein DsbA
MALSLRAAALMVFAVLTPMAQAAPPVELKEGANFKWVREAIAPQDRSSVLVEEFFWYGCSHCFAFDPLVQEWKARLPADVRFVRVPTSLGRREGVLHSRAFYAAEALGISERMHQPLFDAIHRDNNPLDTPQALWAIFDRQVGILPEVFQATLNSPAVDDRVRKAEAEARSYGVSGVPTIVVGGKYFTSASMAGSATLFLPTVDALVEKLRSEQAQH